MKARFWRGGDKVPPLWRAATISPALEGAVATLFAADWRAVFLGTLRAADVVAIAMAGIASYVLRHGSLDALALFWWQILTGCVLGAVTLSCAHVYTFRSLHRRARHFAAVAAAWGATALVIMAILFLAKVANEVSRIWVMLWAVTGLACLGAVRLAAWVWLVRWSKAGKLIFNIAVVGSSAAAAKLAQEVERCGAGDLRLLGIFRTGMGDAEVEALAALARNVRVDEILVAIHCPDSENIREALHTLGTLPADVKLCLDFDGGANSLSMQPLLLSRRPLAGWGIIVKRIMDVALGAALLILFGPLMLLLAALVKLDSPGPVIFRQRRFGFNMQPFTVYKFRTMVSDAIDPTLPQAQRSDPRVTRLGRFLRRTSFDELPQLFNVLAGSMSMVGPRPHAIVHDEKYAALIDRYFARHRVLPGITGWAQVNGLRGETETTEKMARRVEFDLFYIEHWSPLFDLRILARTLRVGFGDRNAY
jgi:putative colanic acid biosynthesis UDP-glucose lipid carrier transferase